MPTLKIEFPNQNALEHFAQWLDGIGEQGYWDWMECRESEQEGEITVRFHYFPSENNNFPEDDARRYGKFIDGNVIHTTLRPRKCEVDYERCELLGINPKAP